MRTTMFEEFLATLDGETLSALLTARPDACLEPVPRGSAQLAQRLSGANSIVAALHTIDRDVLCVGQAIAMLHGAATVTAVSRLLDADEAATRACLGELTGRGLAWPDGARLHLPEILADHWTAEAGGGDPVSRLAPSVLLDDLRVAAAAYGIDSTGVRKAALLDMLADAMADPRSLLPRITELTEQARDRLHELRLGGLGLYFGFAATGRRAADPSEVLIAKGLALRTRSLPVVPREVAVAAWLAENDLRLTGRPVLPAAQVEASSVRAAAQAAARDSVRGVSTLLDEAGRTPIAALKRGGIGPRERSRLGKRLSMVDDELLLWIDLAHAAGLLDETGAGYAPTGGYPRWRDAEPARQWAVLALAWYRLEHAPLSREAGDDRDIPPPLPLDSAAGTVRRTVLGVSRPGRSVRGSGAEIGWFYPMQPYDAETLGEKVAAALREADLLGVTAGDRMSELGEQLLATETTADAAGELGKRCSSLLPAAVGTVILQSDLTAVVSGQPLAVVSRLLAASAVREARGTAEVWRFTPASVRAALDAGWTAEQLRGELTDVTDRTLPQPLEYLINDAARRHGSVRVRPVRSCLVADEALVTEILHTRSLAGLRLARLADTVLTSPREPDEVLARLRAAGLSPVTEDDAGNVRVEKRGEHRAPERPADPMPRATTRVAAADLARRLLADPRGHQVPPGAAATLRRIARLNPELNGSEVALLAHAVDGGGDVLIAYRDKNGSHTIRQIRPVRISERWLESWCYLRNAEREFAVANIESVAPAG